MDSSVSFCPMPSGFSSLAVDSRHCPRALISVHQILISISLFSCSGQLSDELKRGSLKIDILSPPPFSLSVSLSPSLPLSLAISRHFLWLFSLESLSDCTMDGNFSWSRKWMYQSAHGTSLVFHLGGITLLTGFLSGGTLLSSVVWHQRAKKDLNFYILFLTSF